MQEENYSSKDVDMQKVMIKFGVFFFLNTSGSPSSYHLSCKKFKQKVMYSSIHVDFH